MSSLDDLKKKAMDAKDAVVDKANDIDVDGMKDKVASIAKDAQKQVKNIDVDEMKKKAEDAKTGMEKDFKKGGVQRLIKNKAFIAAAGVLLVIGWIFIGGSNNEIKNNNTLLGISNAEAQNETLIPQPIMKIGHGCPTGYHASGGYCNPLSNSVDYAINKKGPFCPSGYGNSGENYCVAVSNTMAKHSMIKSGNHCPSGYVEQGNGAYCQKM